MGFTSIARYYIDDNPCFAANGVLILRSWYVLLEVLLMYGLVSRALYVRQLLLHFLISGGAFGVGRGSQRRLRSWSILYMFFDSCSVAQVCCILMLLLVLRLL